MSFKSCRWTFSAQWMAPFPFLIHLKNYKLFWSIIRILISYYDFLNFWRIFNNFTSHFDICETRKFFWSVWHRTHMKAIVIPIPTMKNGSQPHLFPSFFRKKNKKATVRENMSLKKFLAVNLSQGKNVASHSLATEEKRGG